MRAPSSNSVGVLLFIVCVGSMVGTSNALLRIAIPYLAGRTSACAELQQLVAGYPYDNVTINCYPGAQMPAYEAQTFVASNPPYDITACAAYRLGVYSNNLADLSDTINAAEYEKRDFFDEILHSGNEYPPNSGTFIGSPWASDMQAITYKKSVFAAHNKTFPAFLEDLPAIAEYFKQRPEFDGGMTGIECTSASDATCLNAGVLNVLSGSAILFGLGGSFWNPNTYQVKGYVNSERNIQSAQVVKRLFDTSINRGKNTGYAAMTTNFFNSLCGAARATPLALGYVGFAELAVMSRCPAAMQDTESVAVPFSRDSDVSSTSLALISLAIPKSSPNLAGAKRLLTYLTSRAAQAKGTSWGFPVRKSVVNMPAFVLNSNGSLIGPRLVYAQSLQRGVSCAPMISNSGPVTAIHDQALMALINGNDTSEAYIRSLYNSVAERQQALIDAVYPCGPVCPLQYERSEPMALALLSLHSICLILSIGVGVVFIFYWKTPAIRASTPIFMVFILVGTLLMFVSGILSYEKNITDERCVAVNWTMSFGMQIVFVALVIKTYRIAAIFGKKQITKVVITTAQLVRAFFLWIGLFFAYMMIWTYVSAPHVVTEKNLRDDGQYEQWQKCDYGFFSTYDILLQFLLLMCASVLAFQVRSAPSAFHEGKYLGFGLYNWVLITALVFLMNNMSTNPNIENLARSLHILLVAPVILLTSFGPKFFAAYTNAEVSTGSDNSSRDGSSSPRAVAGKSPASHLSKTDGPVLTSKMSHGLPPACSSPRHSILVTKPRVSVVGVEGIEVTRSHTTGAEHATSDLPINTGEHAV